MRSTHLSLGGIAGGLTLAFALTACSAMGQTSADSSDGGNQAASTSSTAEPENAGATENSASATAPPQDLQTIGKHPSGEYEDSKVVLNSVTASGGTLTVQFSLENNSAEEEDRKSTRLNSSHVSISYAVFCLKKKKTQHVNEEET